MAWDIVYNRRNSERLNFWYCINSRMIRSLIYFKSRVSKLYNFYKLCIMFSGKRPFHRVHSIVKQDTNIESYLPLLSDFGMMITFKSHL
jgi:hypothetical protein